MEAADSFTYRVQLATGYVELIAKDSCVFDRFDQELFAGELKVTVRLFAALKFA